MYSERTEDEFRAAPSAGCDAESLGNILGLEFRLRQTVPDRKIFNYSGAPLYLASYAVL